MGVFVPYLLYAAALVMVTWVATRRSLLDAYPALLTSAWVGLPVTIFGNSASGGIFLTDIALVATVCRFGRHLLGSEGRTQQGKGTVLFVTLAAWAIGRGLMESASDDWYRPYGLYGVARWLLFSGLILVTFRRGMPAESLAAIVKRTVRLFTVFGCLCLLHQAGIVDLALPEALGPRIAELAATSWSRESGVFGHRMFLGLNSACVAALAIAGLALALLHCWVAPNRWARSEGGVLAVQMILVLLWSFSRSDVVGLIGACSVAAVVAKRHVGLLVRLASVSLGGMALALFVLNPHLETGNETLSRYLDFSQYSWNAEGTGGHRNREHADVVSYLFEHPRILALGTGPNGYRKLVGEGVSTMGFGHNVALHQCIELGLAGAAAVFAWVFVAVAPAFRALSERTTGAYQAVVCTVVIALAAQRLIAGWAVDTLFAVDSMMAANVGVLGVIGLGLSYVQLPVRSCSTVRILRTMR